MLPFSNNRVIIDIEHIFEYGVKEIKNYKLLLSQMEKYGRIREIAEDMGIHTKECKIMVKGEYISEIFRWYCDSDLTVNRRYQRKLVWTLEEKRSFINTIIKNYPVPLFLIVNSKETIKGIQYPRKEIIDGLQRLEAIISFILNKYSVKINGRYQYFNLNVYPGNSILIRRGELKQEYPVIDSGICRQFMLYQLPISTIDANETIVGDIFKRINSTGRKLSSQDLRQAGVISRFSNLVRLTATHLRGDATDDIINLKEISDYSLNSPGLDYGLDINKVFWVEQGIINEDGLRRSKDEEIIAFLYNCILSNYRSGTSSASLNRVYTENSNIYKMNEGKLTPNKINELIELFRTIIVDLEKILSIKKVTFKNLLLKNHKNYNTDLVFIIIFLSLAQLRNEHYEINDYSKISDVLENMADREFNEIIETSECIWNSEVRNHLIDRAKNILIKYMDFNENNPKWNDIFLDFLKQVSAEGQMIDFKIGLHDLRTGSENEILISKCIKTLIAMANTKPRKEGTIVIGISDKESDAIDFTNHYHVEVPKYNEYYVPGIKDEAIKYYGSIQNYLDFIRHSIEKENVDSLVIHNILTTMDTMKYENQTLIVLKLSTDKPLFYDGELYVRYDSNNEIVKIGSSAYYEILESFYTKKDTD